MKLSHLPIALVLSLVTAPTMAADLPARMPVKAAPAPVVALYNWTGFYIGAHVGGAWGTKDWFGTEDFFDPGQPIGSHDVSGFIGGGQVGFNWQAPGSNWVLGVEGQASWTDLKGEHIAGGDEVLQTKVKWLATIAGRVGYAWDRVLLYAKGGAAFVGDKHTHYDTDVPAIVFVGDKTRTGWMVGGGIEVALVGNWTAKGEYNFMDFGNKRITFTDPSGDSFQIGVEQQIHVAKFGINYRFGSWSAPVAARY